MGNEYEYDIFILYISDGKLDIVVPSFVHYLEVLEGSDGDKMPGILVLCSKAGDLFIIVYNAKLRAILGFLECKFQINAMK